MAAKTFPFSVAFVVVSLSLLTKESHSFYITAPTNHQRYSRNSLLIRVRLVSYENDELSSTNNATLTNNYPTTNNHNYYPYPPQAYHFQKDEDEMTFNFISYIDHFSEPYSQAARLIEPRKYARAEQFTNATLAYAPTIDDVGCPSSFYGPVATFLAWNRLPARIVVGTLAYFAFPLLIDVLESFISSDYSVQSTIIDEQHAQVGLWGRLQEAFVGGNKYYSNNNAARAAALLEHERDNLSTLVNFYLPGVSIVLGTYISMTLSILYERMARIQQTVALEAGMLAYCFQMIVDLFATNNCSNDSQDSQQQEQQWLVESAQCVADQIHVLVRDSRGKETMRIMYNNDPYARLLQVVQRYSRQQTANIGDRAMVAIIRDCVKQLFELRSKRMSDEALAMPPTHFDVMTFLSGLLLLGIALGTVATAQTSGVPTELSRFLFSAVVVCYTTIYEMAYDLNRPFDGIYQLRRSGAAMHLLQIKHMTMQHPVLRDRITFDPSVVPTTMDNENKEDQIDNNGSSATIQLQQLQIPKMDAKKQRDIWYN